VRFLRVGHVQDLRRRHKKWRREYVSAACLKAVNFHVCAYLPSILSPAADVDCGGSCVLANYDDPRGRCGLGQACLVDNDCKGFCEEGLCISCDDGTKNGDESTFFECLQAATFPHMHLSTFDPLFLSLRSRCGLWRQLRRPRYLGSMRDWLLVLGPLRLLERDMRQPFLCAEPLRRTCWLLRFT
jgi:hypothetical protein